MVRKSRSKQTGHTRFPRSTLLLYNGLTIVHYLLGGLGLWLGYRSSWAGPTLAAVYLVFAFGQMYLLMPLTVCPHCVYTRLADGRCASGLNVVARKLGRTGNAKRFPARARGLLCPNNLYLAAKVLPIVGLLPALFLNFGWLLLGITLALVALLVVRVLFIFRQVVCVHCLARGVCPNAAAMGLAGR